MKQKLLRIGVGTRIVFAVAFVLTYSLAAEGGGDVSDQPPSFTIELGADEAVCSAYVSQLKRMATRPMLNCGRSEPRPGTHFTPLNRVPLSTDDLYRISEALFGFAEHNNSAYFDLWRERTLEFCKNPANKQSCELTLKERRSTEAAGGRWGEPYTKWFLRSSAAWKYDPEVDIDNDGVRDAVILLRREPCGGENDKGVLDSSPTYAFVMRKDYGAVDEDRTRSIFGHPVVAWPKGLQSERFRYVGDELGIFNFEGKTYFDTFMTSFTDFEGKRVGDASLTSTFGIYLHGGGVTRNICEIRWRGPRNDGSNATRLQNTGR
jgi:hypothetical protein